MARYDVINGVTSTGKILNNDSMYVSSGGTADNTTVNADGYLYVLSGGKADHTTVNADAYALYGRLYVSSGGTADHTTVNEWGELLVLSGGTATNTTVNSNGWLDVWSGGTATGITAVDGAQLDFTVAPGTYVKGTSAGSAFEIKDGVANNFTLKNGDLNLRSGGKADHTTVNEWGHIFVYSGGTADHTTVNENGDVRVYSGGTANNTLANAGCNFYVGPGGTADNTTVSSGGAMAISGTANSTTVKAGGITVFTGGVATNTTVNENGDLYVKDGGKADNTTVNEDGYMFVSNGGSADKTTLNENGDLCVYSGGTATNTTVNDGGELWVKSGGTADKTTLNEGGKLIVWSGGGTATGITAVEGACLVFYVAPDTYAKGTSAGSAFEIKNGVATNFTLTCGELILYSGCTANKTTVSDSGYLVLRSAGTATNTTVNNGGVFDVSSGGTADKTTVNENGHLYVYGGGTANSTTVKDGGSMWVNGTANSVTVSSGGKLDLFEDGVLTGRMTFSSGAVVSAYEGGGIIDFDLTHTSPTSAALLNNLAAVQGTVKYTLTVNGSQNNGAYKLAEGASGFGSKTEITVRNPVGTDIGALTLADKSNSFSYGGKKYTLQLNDESLFVTVVAESGSDNIFTGDVTGTQKDITSGMSALGVNVNALGILNVKPDGNAINTMVNHDGIFMAIKADKVKGLTVNKGGVAYIGSDTVAESFVLNGGKGHIESDGWAFGMSKGKTVGSNTIVKNGGMLFVSAGGHVEGLRASDGGHVIVEGGDINGARFFSATLDAMNGANISAVTLLDGGEMNVFAGGSAQSVHVSEGGILAVESGGELNHINVSSGGILTGVVCSASIVNVYGGTIDFDISGFTPDTAPAYLFEETTLESDEEFPCTLTVGDGQAYGTYGLLDDAYVFKGVITVQNTSGEALGTLAVGSTVNIDGVDYTVNISDYPGYHMTVTIADNAAPTITNIAADITGTTNQDVTVTAEFADNVKLASAQYKVGDGAWTDYTAGVVVTGNATVRFKATDAAGNSTEAQYEVTNIDKEKPTVTNVAADVTAPTNQNVFVTADFEDNGGIAFGQYRIGDGAWTDYIAGVSMEENGTLSFKAVDMAGNESEIVSITIGNIDKVAPTVTNVKADVTTPTYGSVTVTANFADDVSLASKLYKIGDGAWTDYTTGVTVSANTTIYFKAVDTAGNESAQAEYAVTNIETVVPDTTKPVVSNMQASTNKPTNQDVIVTAEFTDDVGVVSKLYMIGDGGWKAYPDAGVVVTENNTVVHFKAFDAAGNESEINSYKVSNIDKVKPTISVTPSTTEPAESVELIPKFADNVKLATRQYRIGNGDWQNYTDVAVKVTTNTTVYFKATDAAGNVATDFYEVSNIKPAAREYGVEEPLNNYLYDKKNKTAPLNLNVYSLDPQIVEAGTSEIQIDKTGSVQKDDRKNFVGKDKEGALDPADFTKITLNSAARIRFNLGGTDAMKFTVWSLIEGEDKKHNPTYKMKSLQSTKLTKQKNTALYTADTKDLLLEAGTYYISMESTGGKKTTEGFYSVQLNDAASDFFTKGDKSDDWGDMKTFGPNGAVGDVGVIDESEPEILIDWVGFGDVKDFKHFTLSSAAKLSFSLNASDASKFTIWKLNSKTNKKEVTTYSLKSLQATTLKKSKNAEGYTATTKSLILDAGEYYFSVESTNAKKGGSADYSVSLNALDNATEFFTKGDNSDDWGNMKTAGPAGAVGDVGVIQGANENLLTDWVGYSDTIDYKKFTLNTDAKLNFEVYSGDAAKFTVWCLDSSTKKNVTTYSLKSLMTVKIKGGEDAKILDTLTLAKGDYYFSMESTNAKKGGSADYNVGVIQFRAQSAQEECALVMPETASVASVLTTPDSLGFDQNDTDMLAGSYLDSASDKLFGESDGGLLASL